MDIILIAGLWLPADVWDATATTLHELGDTPLPQQLPGVDAGPGAATLDDQLEAVLTAIDAADRPWVVGHSAACTLAWLAADRRPDKVAGVMLIGGFPSDDGDTYASFFPIEDGAMAFPGWEPFDGPDSADLDEAARTSLAAITRPVPEGVAKGVVSYADPARSEVPVVVICPEFTPEQAREWIGNGDAPELSAAQHVTFVDIDSGHWPMTSRPDDLARLIHDAAGGGGGEA